MKLLRNIWIVSFFILILFFSCETIKTDAKVKKAVFNETWNLINEHYYLQDFGGLDWQAVKSEYELQISHAAWPDEVYPLLIEMVAVLDDGHTMFLSKPIFTIVDGNSSPNRGSIGITLKQIDSDFIIVKAVQEGSAKEAGVPEESKILAVDGNDVTDYRHAPELRSHLDGAVGTLVQLEYMTPAGTKESVQLERRNIDLFTNAMIVNQLPDIDILYLEIWNFQDIAVSENFQNLITGELDQNRPMGIILDLRRNLGGRIDTMLDIAAFFLPGDTIIGTLTGKNSYSEVVIPSNPGLNALEDMPLAVLVGPNTESAAEILAMALLENNRAKIIGETTGGNVEGTGVAELPDGSRLIIAITDYLTAGNYHIDGKGVEPDINIEQPEISGILNREDDLQLQAAIEWLSSGLDLEEE